MRWIFILKVTCASVRKVTKLLDREDVVHTEACRTKKTYSSKPPPARRNETSSKTILYSLLLIIQNRYYRTIPFCITNF